MTQTKAADRPRIAAGAGLLSVVLLLAGCAAAPMPAKLPAVPPNTQDVTNVLQQADQAYAMEDRQRALRLYAAVVDADPSRSRAIFRLGQLAAPGSDDAVRWFRRYVQLEPRDPWGYMALGDALARAGDVGASLRQYDQARQLAPDEPDVSAGRIRILREANRIDALIETYEALAAQRPNDAELWIEIGRARQRAVQHAEAARAYARAYTLAADAHTLERLDGALAEGASSVRPYAGYSSDSDDNRITKAGLDLLLPAGDRARVGLRAERASVRDPSSSGTADTVALIGSWRPLYAVRTEAVGGNVRLTAPTGRTDDHVIGQLRLRWRESFDSPAADLRLVHQPLVATPLLLAAPVDLTEGRASVDLPMTQAFIARMAGQLGQLKDETQTNTRTGGRASLVYRAQPTWEVLASAGALSYERPSSAGYFAPRRVEAMEIATYFEVYKLWPVTIAFDTGAGRQRITRHGESAGDWSGTFRLWASMTWDIRPGVQLAFEIDHDNSQIGASAATPTANWRSTAVLLSLRFPVWRQAAQSFVQGTGAERR